MPGSYRRDGKLFHRLPNPSQLSQVNEVLRSPSFALHGFKIVEGRNQEGPAVDFPRHRPREQTFDRVHTRNDEEKV